MLDYFATAGPYFITLIFVCSAWWFDTKTKRTVYQDHIRILEKQLKMAYEERDMAFEYLGDSSIEKITTIVREKQIVGDISTETVTEEIREKRV